MADAPLKVMLVDDHEVVREGLRALLNRRPGMTVVAEAGSVAQAIEVAARERPHVEGGREYPPVLDEDLFRSFSCASSAAGSP